MIWPQFLIYGLIDPRDRQLRYVGKSSVGERRTKIHKYVKRSGRLTHKEAWIKGLLDIGLMYEACVLKTSSVEALETDEIEAIAYYRGLGYQLTNLTSGGDGVRGMVVTEETRRNLSRALLGRTQHPEHTRASALARIGGIRSAYTRQKISLANKGKGCRPVSDQNGTLYPSIKGAAETLGLERPHISMVLSGKLRHTKGFVFQYATVSC